MVTLDRHVLPLLVDASLDRRGRAGEWIENQRPRERAVLDDLLEQRDGLLMWVDHALRRHDRELEDRGTVNSGSQCRRALDSEHDELEVTVVLPRRNADGTHRVLLLPNERCL